MRKSVLAMGLLLCVLVSCSEEGSGETGYRVESNVSAVRGVAMVDENSDIEAMLFTVATCEGELVSEEVLPLEDQVIPGNIPELAGSPFDVGSTHLFSDYFLVVDAGCYMVSVQPLDENGESSDECFGSSQELMVEEGETTEVLLIVQCPGVDRGAIDVIAAINHDPSLDDIEFDDSKFVCGNTEQICLEGSDVDNDPLAFELVVPEGCEVTGPPIPHAGQACFDIVCEDGGQKQLIALVYDLLWVDGELMRIDDIVGEEGSVSAISFWAYFDCTEDDVCGPNGETCEALAWTCWHEGYWWAYASPCSGGCSQADPSYYCPEDGCGWVYPETIPELDHPDSHPLPPEAARPLWPIGWQGNFGDMFPPDIWPYTDVDEPMSWFERNNQCAALYFDPTHDHCDFMDPVMDGYYPAQGWFDMWFVHPSNTEPPVERHCDYVGDVLFEVSVVRRPESGSRSETSMVIEE